MTWARTLATGSGKLEARFVIEGLPYQFVSTAAMEVTGVPPAATRINGLKLSDLGQFGDKSDIIGGKITTTSPSIKIADIGGNVTSALSRTPTISTYLAADASAAAGSITVTSNTGFALGDVIHINTEALYVTGTSGGTTISVSRAALNTRAQEHYVPSGDGARSVEVFNYPMTIEGRRCFLYIYGEGDSLTGSGTLIWEGCVSGEARMSRGGTEWTITVGGLDRILEQSEGGGDPLPDCTIRGIYYCWRQPFVLLLTELDTSLIPNVIADPIVLTGFYETQQEFCDALNAQIASVTTGFTQTLYAEPHSEGWDLILGTSATNARWVTVELSSTIDAEWNRNWVRLDGPYHISVRSVSDNATYQRRFYAGVPRSSGMANFTPASIYADPTVSDQFPHSRAYLDANLTNVTAGSMITIQVTDTTGHTISETRAIDNIDTADNFIDLDAPLAGLTISRGLGILYNSDQIVVDYTPTISINVAPLATGTLSDYLASVVNNSLSYVNTGALPFFTSSEIDLTTSVENIDAVTASRLYAQNRRYGITKRKFSEILAEELKLIGCYLAIDANADLVVKQAVFPNASQVTVTLDNSNILVDREWPMWERNSYGLVNHVEIKTGYSFREDTFQGNTITYKDSAASSLTRTPKKVSITPYTEGNDISTEDGARIASELTGLFGYPYATIRLQVKLTVFNEAIAGAVVAITSDKIPDFSTGTRSSSSVYYGLILGRTWDLMAARGTLEIYVPLIRHGGYVPAAYVSSQSGSSASWTLTVTDFSPWSSTSIYQTGKTTSDYFASGMRVRVYQADDDSSVTELSGSVTSVSGNDVAITFDSAWTPGTDTWVLTYDVATAALTSAQLQHSYIAGTDMRIDHSTAVTAKVFTG